MSQLKREHLTVTAEKAVLVAVHLPGQYIDRRDPLAEIRSLAETAGAFIVGEMIQNLPNPNGRTFLGKGKVGELAELVKMTGATLIIFDNDLAPNQIKAVEEDARCKVIDRSELILDIFANRAATTAAKLQVEIAQLEYTYPRLRAMWNHLEQIVGGAPVGIGTRGPGEKQLEIDRRLVQRRLKNLKDELEEVQARKTREVARRNIDHFTVGLVGYTNAGKSTLFNRLTEGGGAFADPKLFATLATRVERWDLGGGNAAMLSDTVGFIRDLPHHLVASFRSTLEETVFAQLLLIVIDASDPNARMHLQTVNATLDEIGATTQPRVLVLNKIDQLEDKRDLLLWIREFPEALVLSARTGEGLEELTDLVRKSMIGEQREITINAPLSDSRTIDFLEKRADVIDRIYENSHVTMRVRVGRRHMDQLLALGSRMTVDGLPAHEGVRKIWGPPPAPRPVRVRPHEQY